jgi:glycosyltransferase involved in cell wall biosynthesis
MSRCNKFPDFTICIPTYNRGSKALNLVNVLREEINENWDILVLDNNSTNESEQYSEINDMSKKISNVRYIKQHANVNFEGNFLSCFEECCSDFFMVISDEDFVNVDFVNKIVPQLMDNPGIGIVRGSIAPYEGLSGESLVSIEYPDNYFQKGKDALYNFSFYNNYPHGTIYNKKLANEKGIVCLLRKNLIKQGTYPHLYVDMLISAVADVMISSEVGSFEGSSGKQHWDDQDRYLSPAYSFGGRLNQLMVLRDAIFESVKMVNSNFDEDLFVLIYLKLCEKYYYLVSKVNMMEFVSHHQLNPVYIQKSLLYFCCAAVSVDARIQNLAPILIEKIEKIHVKWEEILQGDISNMSTEN